MICCSLSVVDGAARSREDDARFVFFLLLGDERTIVICCLVIFLNALWRFFILMRLRIGVLVLVVVCLGSCLFVGCLGETSPVVRIVSPTYGGAVSAGNVTVHVRLLNYPVVAESGADRVAGQGHLHYYLDRAPPIVPGEPAITQPGTYGSSESTSFVWSNVSAGVHTFGVELVNGDDTPLSPVVRDQVQVMVVK